MDRSTSKETTTKMVNTEATDHVGVKAKDLSSFSSLAILNEFLVQYTTPQNSLVLSEIVSFSNHNYITYATEIPIKNFFSQPTWLLVKKTDLYFFPIATFVVFFNPFFWITKPLMGFRIYIKKNNTLSLISQKKNTHVLLAKNLIKKNNK